MTEDNFKAILKEYDTASKNHETFAVELERLLRKILGSLEMPDNRLIITSRLKSRVRLEEKLRKKGNKYNKLADITDITGVRIITLRADDIDKVASIVQEQFDIDWDNSVDKRQHHDPDRFGYASLQYVIQLPPTRRDNIENRNFKDLKAEIQIRSVLQHAWAEIDHGIGYEHPEEIPKAIKRRFSRLAGLLELADDEFTAILKDQEDYQNMVKEQMGIDPHPILLDAVSILQFVCLSPLLKQLESDVLAASGKEEDPGVDIPDIERKVRELTFMGMSTVGDVINKLHEHKQKLFHYMVSYRKSFPRAIEQEMMGSPLTDLCICLAAANGRESLRKFVAHKLEFDDPSLIPDSLIDDNFNLARQAGFL